MLSYDGVMSIDQNTKYRNEKRASEGEVDLDHGLSKSGPGKESSGASRDVIAGGVGQCAWTAYIPCCLSTPSKDLMVTSSPAF